MKRIILALLIFTMLLPAIGAGAVSVEETIGTDAAVGLLSSISDIENYVDPAGTEAVTRAQFVKALTAAFNVDISLGADAAYSDIDNELKPFAAAAAACGIISKDTTFRPNDPVTLNEALKMTLTAAGLDVKAKQIGGYPIGYARVASEYDITDGVSDGEVLVPADVYTLFYNTLICPMLVQTEYGETFRFASSETETVLSDLWDIYYDEAVMNANEYTVFGNEGANNLSDTIEVGGIKYKTELDVNGLLGHNVRVYYKDVHPTRIAVYAASCDTEVVTLYPTDYPDYENGNIIYYNENDKKDSYKLSSVPEYIFNGKVCYSLNVKSMIPETGLVQLIDNDLDGRYDVVDISSYYYMKVDSVDFYNRMMYSADDMGQNIDYSDEESAITVTDAVTGEVVKITDIGTGSILAVERSLDKKIYNIKVLTNSVTGEIKEYSEDENIISIADKNGEATDYKMSPYFRRNDGRYIVLGESSDFALGIFGEAVTMDVKKNKMAYGYAMGIVSESGLDNRYQIKIFTTKGEFIIADFAEKVSIDAETAIKKTDAYDTLMKSGGFKPQLIRYALDADNCLARVDLAEETTGIDLSGAKKDPYNCLTKHILTGTGSYRNGNFFPYFNTAGVQIMRVPTEANTMDEEEYSMGFSLVNDMSANNFVPYDIDAGGSVAFMLAVDVQEDTSLTSNIVMIEKIVSALDKDDTPCKKIYGWQGGKYVELLYDSNLSITANGTVYTLAPGDVIRYTVDNKGKLESVTVDFIAADMKTNSENGGIYNVIGGNIHYQHGKVISSNGSYAYLSKDGSFDYSDAANLNNVKLPGSMVEYNLTTGKVRTVDSKAIKTYFTSGEDASYVVIRQHHRQSQVGFIYNR